jgi:secreted PhoX family phosphatase
VKRKLLCAALCAAISGTASAHGRDVDFGKAVETLAKFSAPVLFGTRGTLDESSTESLTADEANAHPERLLTVAPGLSVSVVSAEANLGANIDMMVLWPQDDPTHLIACNEQAQGQVGVQRVDLKTGKAEDIVSGGLRSCDPVEVTPWGTVIVGEERGGDGSVYEIIAPLTTTGVTVDRAAHTTSDESRVRAVTALGHLAFEGVSVLPNGVIYYQDERRPGNGNPGGSIFKFIPSTLWTGGPAITTLDASPLATGAVYGFRAGVHGTDFGRGSDIGRGKWVPVPGAADADLNAVALANNLSLSANYRPEDIDLDLGALAKGNVRFCGNNTGEDTEVSATDGDNHFGEVFCVTDGTVNEAGTNAAVPEYQVLVPGNFEFAMMDNIAYQPGRGNWLINEDGEGPNVGRNNDIWDCLDDGADTDDLADACVRVMTINDLNAETTGGLFNATGDAYYVSVQHNVTGHGVILKVTGWR